MSSAGSKALLHVASGLALATACVSGVGARAETGASNVDSFRVQMEKWVETRQLISKETSDWEADQETLRATRDLLAQQKKALEGEIEELEESSTEADEERRTLLLERGEFQRANEALEETLRAMELEVLALARQLPQPLREKLDLLLVQIPEDPESSRQGLGQRLLAVLGVLTQADKWNSTASFVAETREVGEQKLQVRTLYWGLGQAYYVDAMGRTAGVGLPGDEGWVFVSDPALADTARRLVDIYEGNLDLIEFVELPVEIH
jgi:gas vesicle protein